MQTQTKIKPFSLIVAVAKNNAIGLKGDLPWAKIPKEMKHFKDITTSREPLSLTPSEYAFNNCFYQSELKLTQTAD